MSILRPERTFRVCSAPEFWRLGWGWGSSLEGLRIASQVSTLKAPSHRNLENESERLIFPGKEPNLPMET